MSYESIKSYVSEHRQSVITAGLCVVIFVVGYGTGTSWHVVTDKSSAPFSLKQNNYTTKPTPAPPDVATVEGGVPTETMAQTQVKGAQTTTTKSTQATAVAAGAPGTGTCPVKGNISKDSKIYHVLGGSFYNRVKPELCFQTEVEAQAAGFRKSTR